MAPCFRRLILVRVEYDTTRSFHRRKSQRDVSNLATNRRRGYGIQALKFVKQQAYVRLVEHRRRQGFQKLELQTGMLDRGRQLAEFYAVEGYAVQIIYSDFGHPRTPKLTSHRQRVTEYFRLSKPLDRDVENAR